MLQELINHSPDIRQLADEGYNLEFKGGYLHIHHIPYVNSLKEVQMGTLVSSLTLNGHVAQYDNNHVIQFMGEQPCDKEGNVINSISHTDTVQDLGNNIIINRSFSNKPPEGYKDYYEKFKRYAEIISAPAKSIKPEISATPFLPIKNESEDSSSVFKYVDTNTSRANIGFINEKFNNQKIGIIGLGGTGAYILDLVAKTGVAEIRLFDNDILSTHNAFRSPGAASFEELSAQYSKVDFYTEKYSRMHKNIIPNRTFLYEENLHLIADLDFIFIAIDRNTSRKVIAEFLYENHIPFIDVGLGVELVDGQLTSVVRLSSFFTETEFKPEDRLPFEETKENAYNSNIQIAELNSLNANLAVIKWKKFLGFYQDLNLENHSVYCLNANQLTDERA